MPRVLRPSLILLIWGILDLVTRRGSVPQECNTSVLALLADSTTQNRKKRLLSKPHTRAKLLSCITIKKKLEDKD